MTVPGNGSVDVSGEGVLRTRARDEIRDLIASGELKAGDHLGEAALSARIGVSRSPIREALRELEHQGVVVSYPNRGAFVVALDGSDIDDILFVRGWLEGLAARLASDRLARRDFMALEELVARMRRCAGSNPPDYRGSVEADAAFHAIMVRASGNQRLIRIWDSLDPTVWLIRLHPVTPRPDRLRAVPTEHQELIDALRASPDQAEDAARFHIIRGREHMPAGWPAAKQPL